MMDRSKICTTRLLDQNFGMTFSPKDVLLPFFNGHSTNYYRPWKLFNECAEECCSTIDNTKDKFKVILDVQHFKPNEISVRVNDREIIIEGKHEERQDDYGFISRQFIRRYILPKECSPDTVTSSLSSDGVLAITANKIIAKDLKYEKMIPIKMCGPFPKNEAGKKEEMKNGTCDNKMEMCTIDKKDTKKEEIDKNELKMDVKMDKTNLAIDKKEKVAGTEIGKEIKTDIDKKDTQTMLKEEHCRLLKPQLLKDAVSTTEKLISESKKEADELLKLLSTDKQHASTSDASEKLDEVLGLCKTAISELKKDKLGESIFTSESASFKSSMTSESIETKESSSFTSISSNLKASSEKSSDIVSEIICAELKEASENI
ncbi:uncharacterized protein LOC113230654 [Hyposmocoma kahamanoa]|uniref:uncharacterized protein LOC113230654 n=1 Tax=Hyposmocoma kahamanoa TaxID=1477025 RepID=UPI000E6D6A1C|nr:uncharacterized protein LOC113230654 [Hyposmocoma kahamanoa]XP_026320454.1 uncharacterized protein LOC113230654 [Hyposmocoma kahamanoa]XP_026320455.1 uncharacterized protein LOC113230654 [Hyposmocoma kahamanoa]